MRQGKKRTGNVRRKNSGTTHGGMKQAGEEQHITEDSRRIGAWEAKDDAEDEPTLVQGRGCENSRRERHECGQKEARNTTRN